MASTIDELLQAMRDHPAGVRFADACKVADHFFGEPTQKRSSHRVWKMPWPGNPRVNMQNEKGSAKVYQVRQLLEAVEKRLTQLSAQEMGTPSHEQKPPPGAARKEKKTRKKPKK